MAGDVVLRKPASWQTEQASVFSTEKENFGYIRASQNLPPKCNVTVGIWLGKQATPSISKTGTQCRELGVFKASGNPGERGGGGVWNQERLDPAFGFVTLSAIQRLNRLVLLPRMAREHRDRHRNSHVPKPANPLRLPAKWEWLLPSEGHRRVSHGRHTCSRQSSAAGSRKNPGSVF